MKASDLIVYVIICLSVTETKLLVTIYEIYEVTYLKKLGRHVLSFEQIQVLQIELNSHGVGCQHNCTTGRALGQIVEVDRHFLRMLETSTGRL